MYKKILLINPFGIGDVLFTTPIIHTLKDSYPGVKIGYLCNSRTAPVLENNPHVSSLFVYERDEFELLRKRSFFAWLCNIFRFMNQIKNERFDAVFDFSLNTQYGFFSWYAGIKERVGYDYKNRGFFLNKKIKLSGYAEKHIVEYYADLLKYLGLDLKYRRLELYLDEKDKAQAKERLNKEGVTSCDFLVAMIPAGGRSWGKDACLKHWPPESFAALADKVVENYKAKIIIMGDFSQDKIARDVIGRMHQKAINFSGRTTIIEFSALLEKMDLVIANDGGPLHIAVALGKKTLSFFGPVDPKVYGPYPHDESRHIVLKKDLGCSPCYRGFRLIDCAGNKECLNGIGIEAALEAVKLLAA